MTRVAILFAILVAMATSAMAAPPRTISYQGVLTDAGGTPLANGNYSLTFRLYNVSTGGSALWTETQGSVALNTGEFSVTLGSVTGLNLPFDVPYWLGISVASDPELSPRLPLASAPYAFYLVAGPGISQGKANGGVAITSTSAMADVVTTQITIPADGYIIVDASAWAVLNGTTGDNHVDYQIDETALGTADANQYRSVGGQGYPNTNFYNATAVARRIYTKSAGVYTFRLEALKQGSGSCSFLNPQITAIYIPASYGTVTQ